MDGETDPVGRRYYSCPGLDDMGDSAAPLGDPARQEGDHETRTPCARAEANLISSLCEDGQHRPVIDLDIPCRLVESSTAGHFHLYIDVAMDPEQMLAMLRAMVEAGVVQPGFLRHAEQRGAAFVRPEGVTKGMKRA
jgi:hypothetical protein